VSEPVGKSVEEYLAEQKAEWGKYVAAEPIDIDGVRAFNPGNPVPASHVERGVVSAGQVTEVAKTSEKKKG
jgi:hypothetical protein